MLSVCAARASATRRQPTRRKQRVEHVDHVLEQIESRTTRGRRHRSAARTLEASPRGQCQVAYDWVLVPEA